MSASQRACVLVMMAGLLPAVQAADPPVKKPATNPATNESEPAKKPAPQTDAEADEELLEFLGSVDGDTGDQDWIDYLSETDIAKVAKGRKDE